MISNSAGLIAVLRQVSLDGVAVSATIDADGTLGRVGGIIPKLLAGLSQMVTPMHTAIVAYDQDGLEAADLRDKRDPSQPAILQPDRNEHFFRHRDKEFQLIRAKTLVQAIELLKTNKETRFPINDCQEVLRRHTAFVGRDWLWPQVDQFIESPDASVPGYLLLEAVAGFGKTAIAARLIERLARHRPVYHLINKDQNWDDPADFLESMIHQIRRRMAPWPVNVAMNTPNKDRLVTLGKAFAQALRAAADGLPPDEPGQPPNRLLVILDGLDEAFGPHGRYTATALPGILPRILPPQVRIILTTRPDDSLAWRSDRTACRSVRASTADQDRDIREHLSDRNVRDRLHLPQWFITKLAEAAAHNFMAAFWSLDHRSADELESWQNDPGLIPKGLDGWLQRFWNNALAPPTPDQVYWPELARAFLGLLACAAEPLGESVLKCMLGFVSTARTIGFRSTQQIIDQLPLLTKRTRSWFHDPLSANPDAGKIFIHPRCREFIDAQLTLDERRDCHDLLGEVGQHWDDAKTHPIVRRYALRHGPRHLTLAAQWDVLVELLMSWRFLEFKAKAPGEHPGSNLMIDLAADILAAAEAMVDLPEPHADQWKLARIAEAMGCDLHFLARHPGSLFQCLWNRCWWYDCSEAEQHYAVPNEGWERFDPPWRRRGKKLSEWMERWSAEKHRATGNFPWLRSLCPPPQPLGSALKWVLFGHTEQVTCVAFSLDGHIISGSADKTVRVWDSMTGRELLPALTGHESPVLSVAISADGCLIASGSGDTTVTHIDPVTGRKTVTGPGDTTIRVWDSRTGFLVMPPLIGHTDCVWSVDFSADGSRILSSSRDGTFRVWDSRTGCEVLRVTSKDTRWFWDAAYSVDSRLIVLAADDDTVRVCNATSGVDILPPLRGHTGAVRNVVFSNDGRIVSGSSDNTIRVWDSSTGREIVPPFTGHDSTVTSVAISTGGDRIVSGAWDKTVRIWDLRNDREFMPPLIGHTGSVTSVAIANDGRHIVSGSDDGTLRVWDLQAGRDVLPPLMGHTDLIVSIAISSDGGQIASGSRDNTVRLWNLRTGHGTLPPLTAHYEMVSAVAFSADGSRVVSGSWDTTVCVWDSVTGRLLLPNMTGHTGAVEVVSFTNDNRIISVCTDLVVRVWDSVSGECLDTEQAKVIRSVSGHPEELSSRILANLKTVVESPCGQPIACIPAELRRSDNSWVFDSEPQTPYVVADEVETSLTLPGGQVVAWFHIGLRGLMAQDMRTIIGHSANNLYLLKFTNGAP